jgi:hypothetical protein
VLLSKSVADEYSVSIIADGIALLEPNVFAVASADTFTQQPTHTLAVGESDFIAPCAHLRSENPKCHRRQPQL